MEVKHERQNVVIALVGNKQDVEESKREVDAGSTAASATKIIEASFFGFFGASKELCTGSGLSFSLYIHTPSLSLYILLASTYSSRNVHFH